MASTTIPNPCDVGSAKIIRLNIAGNSSLTLTFKAQTNAGFFFIGGNNNKGIYAFNSSSSGSLSGAYLIQASGLTFSNSSNVMTISNTASGYTFIALMVVTGDLPT